MTTENCNGQWVWNQSRHIPYYFSFSFSATKHREIERKNVLGGTGMEESGKGLQVIPVKVPHCEHWSIQRREIALSQYQYQCCQLPNSMPLFSSSYQGDCFTGFLGFRYWVLGPALFYQNRLVGWVNLPTSCCLTFFFYKYFVNIIFRLNYNNTIQTHIFFQTTCIFSEINRFIV